ncbi:MAG: hypothetical protein D3925_10575, partial [Candidatus Electrothrix sp. AR5]|nr:hypothetical protein [Candidatus Electrothrix sp. AR5]
MPPPPFFIFYIQRVNSYFNLQNPLAKPGYLLYILVLIHLKYVDSLFATSPEILLKDKNCKIMLKIISPVGLTACSSYDTPDLSPALDQVLNTLELPTSLGSSEVLLKPNLISAKAGPLACTEGTLILAVARWFIDQGARVGIG